MALQGLSSLSAEMCRRGQTSLPGCREGSLPKAMGHSWNQGYTLVSSSASLARPLINSPGEYSASPGCKGSPSPFLAPSLSAWDPLPS